MLHVEFRVKCVRRDSVARVRVRLTRVSYTQTDETISQHSGKP